jgi:hypothetical protein
MSDARCTDRIGGLTIDAARPVFLPPPSIRAKKRYRLLRIKLPDKFSSRIALWKRPRCYSRVGDARQHPL